MLATSRLAAHAGRVPARLIALLLSLTLGAGCAARTPAPSPWEPWQGPLGRDHPLAGRIVEVATGRTLAPDALVARLAHARFVLLGERHDSADHHRLQAWIVGALVGSGVRPAVAFEQFAADRQQAIDGHLATRPRDASGLGTAVAWHASGWPDWSLYQPIADAAVSAGLPIVAADISRQVLQAVRQGGIAALDEATRGRLGLDRPLDAKLREGLKRDIVEGHCGHVSERAVERMIEIQRTRDAWMADVLATPGGAAVLIAGSGHARADHGVPAHLAWRAPEGAALSVGLVEVAAGVEAWPAYAARFGSAALPFDYVWFTARVDDIDPCEKFRRSLQQLRGR